MAHVAVTRLAIGRDAQGAVVELQQGRDAWIYDKGDIATATTVAAVRTTEGLELLAADGRAAMPAVASSNVQCRCWLGAVGEGFPQATGSAPPS